MCERLPLRRAAIYIGMTLAAACGNNAADTPTLQPLTLPPAPTATLEMSPTPPPELTPSGPLKLVIWWPDALAAAGDAGITAQLRAQLADYETAQTDVMIELRLKKSQGAGGILETLRSTTAVAPGARPDLLLVQRADLLAAVQANLLEPLEGRVSSAILGDLYTAALELGQIGGQLYGLAYALEALHVAYRPPVSDFTSFESALTGGRPLAFAAEHSTSISDVFLLHYLSAGGSLSDLNVGRVNADALRAVLQFYDEAAAQDILPATMTSFTAIGDYLQGVRDGQWAGVVTTTLYQQLAADGETLRFAPIPTASGRPASLVDGWMWVTTAASGDRQAAVMRFLDWMFEIERQAELTRAIGWLPSQRTALRVLAQQAQDGDGYLEFVNQLLANAWPTPAVALSVSTARVLENALLAVISDQQSAEEAVQTVLSQLMRS